MANPSDDRTGATVYGYGAILSGLERCGDPLVTAEAINASSWCSGCAGGRYVIDFIQLVESEFNP